MTIVSFLFFMGTLLVFYVWQQLAYFVLSTAFLVVYIFTMVGWVMQRRNVVSIYENGISYRKCAATWDEIKLVRSDVKTGADNSPSFEPGLADRLHGALVEAAQQQELRSEPAVLLVPTVLRPWLARFVRHGVPNLGVLAYGEIPHNKSLRVVANVGSPGAARAGAPRAAAVG